MFNPGFIILKRKLPAFLVIGSAGFVIAVVAGLWAVTLSGLSKVVLLELMLMSAFTFFVVAFATKIIKGKEELIYYHHEIAIVIASSVLLAILRQPLLPYLDVVILGIGIFLMFGRVGCLIAGCCHGKPYCSGIIYKSAHVKIGFPECYADIKIFPIQAIESSWVLLTVLAGFYIFFHQYPAGSAFAWYLIVYDLGRFSFEFWRGDSGRPYYAGFSEAQWISVIITWIVVILERVNLLPVQQWHILAALLLTLAMVVIRLTSGSNFSRNSYLLHPQHLKEITPFIRSTNLIYSADQIKYLTTSRNLIISFSFDDNSNPSIEHYALSGTDGNISKKVSRSIGRHIIHLVGCDKKKLDIKAGANGVFHLFVSRKNSLSD